MFVGKKVSTLYTLLNLCKDKQQRDSGPSMIFFSIDPRLCTHAFLIPPMLISVNISLLSRKLLLFIGRVTVSRLPLNLPLTTPLFIFYIVSSGVIYHITLSSSLSGYPILYHSFFFCLLDFASHHCVDLLLSRFPRYLSRNFLSSKRNT